MIYQFIGIWRDLIEDDGPIYWDHKNSSYYAAVLSIVSELKMPGYIAKVAVSKYSNDYCFAALYLIESNKDCRCFWSKYEILSFEDAKKLAEKILIGVELFGIDVFAKNQIID